MRYSPLMIPLAALGLAACTGAAPSWQAAAPQTSRASTITFMTPEQSSPLIILPGDTTTPVQLRALANAGSPTRDGWQAAASSDPGADEAPLLASNLSR
jgi:hypothetical protein